MAAITFDKQRNATISIDCVGNNISFLMNPVFDNSESNLLRDTELCDNEEMKRLLVSFYEHIKAIGGHIKNAEYDNTESELSFEFEPGKGGDWCGIVHNIKAEHSGYWYAAQNLEAERCSLIQLRHELEGIKICTENIESVITCIRSAVSPDDAAIKLFELGLDISQAKAILRMKLPYLAAYEPSGISNEIESCERWIKIIENLTRN